jgi:hypothetical protein
MSNIITQSLITAIAASEAENQVLRLENQALRDQLAAERSAINSLREQLALKPAVLCVEISTEEDKKKKLAEKKRQYILKNEVDCECGGKSSKTPSVKAIHEKTKQHMENVPNERSESVAFAFQKWKAVAKEEKKLNKQRDARNECKIKCACGGVSYSGKRWESVKQRHDMSDRHKQYVATMDDMNQFSDSIDDLV